jgi:hypothetical protein
MTFNAGRLTAALQEGSPALRDSQTQSITEAIALPRQGIAGKPTSAGHVS